MVFPILTPKGLDLILGSGSVPEVGLILVTKRREQGAEVQYLPT